MGNGKTRFLALVMAGMLVLFGSIATANIKTIQDPADRPNSEGGIDIKSASHGHTKTGKLKHKIVTYDVIAELEQACLYIKTAADTYYSCGYKMYNSADQQTGGLTESRPNNKTIVFKFKPGAIGNPSTYLWWVEANNYCQQCDRAPNTGKVRHNL